MDVLESWILGEALLLRLNRPIGTSFELCSGRAAKSAKKSQPEAGFK